MILSDSVGTLNLLLRHLHGELGQVSHATETKYRRLIVMGKQRMRRCLDVGQPATAVA